jgi:cyclophilin family peptidyl-prolyl cis-trans isomerase
MHTIFGEVVEGADVLDELTRRDPNESPTFEGDKILSVEIEELDSSVLPTPSPMPPTPTPFPPSSLDAKGRPLADVALPERVNYFSAEPEMTLDTAKQYTATIETSKGTLVAELYDDSAPKAVNNFVSLANLGFFDGTPVNSVNPGTLLVIGSPDNVLPNDAGYRFVPEVNLPEAPKSGALAYAPIQPGPDGIEASSSVLFVALAPPPAEAGAQYGFFGSVVQGLDALKALTVTDTISSVTISVSE